MRVGFFVDPHFSSFNPASRIDDYPGALSNKMQQIVEMSEGLDLIICAGDFFHVKSISFPYFCSLISILRKSKCPLYSIVGNHDIFWTNLSTIDRVPLGVLFFSHVVKRLVSEEFPSVKIVGYDYRIEPDVSSLQKEIIPGKINILVAHQFFAQNRGNETIGFSDIEGFDLVLLGHDHNFFKPEVVGKSLVLRPGSISRGTQHHANSKRDCFFVVIDTETMQVDFRPLVIKPYEEVFLMEGRERLDSAADVVDFVKSLKESCEINSFSIEEEINALEMDNEVRGRLKSYLHEFNLI